MDATSTRGQIYQFTNIHSAYDIRSEYWATTSSKVVRKAFVSTSQPWRFSNAGGKKSLQVILRNTGQDRNL